MLWLAMMVGPRRGRREIVWGAWFGFMVVWPWHDRVGGGWFVREREFRYPGFCMVV